MRKIGRGEAELVMRGRPPLIGAIIGAGKLHPRHNPIALGDHLQNLGMVIRKCRKHGGDEPFAPIEAECGHLRRSPPWN